MRLDTTNTTVRFSSPTLKALPASVSHFSWKKDTYKMLFMQLFSMGCFIFLFTHIVKMPQFYRSFGFLSVDVSEKTRH